MYTYQLYQWLAFFYIYCFFGWIFESTYVSLKSRRLVNRGFLRMPMLPLYGTGAVMMLWVSLPVKDNIYLVYLSGVAAATVLEYITGYVMEKLFKMKYWDYSNQKFQFRGYICLSSSIAWGFLTIFLTEVIHTPIEHFVLSLNPVVMAVCLIPITFIFLSDSIRSTKTALDFGKMLESIDKLRAEMDELQVQLALLKAEAAQRAAGFKEDTLHRAAEIREGTVQKAAEFREGTVQKAAEFRDETVQRAAEFRDETVQRAAEFRDETVQRAAEFRDETAQKAAEIKERIQALSEKRFKLSQPFTLKRGYIFRNNPSASSKHFPATFKELKEMLDQMRK